MGFGFRGLRFRDSSLGKKGSTRSYWRVEENEEFNAHKILDRATVSLRGVQV